MKIFYSMNALNTLGNILLQKKKLKEILQKKIRNKKIYEKVNFNKYLDKELIIMNVINKLDELKIINESHYLESMFNYYQQSLFSIRKIRNKLYQKGFDEKKIDKHISLQLQESPELEVNILKKYIQKKKIKKPRSN